MARGDRLSESEARLDRLMNAMADRTRRAILVRLVQGEARVTEVAEPFGISLNAVSKHIKVLEQSGLVRRRIEGRDHLLTVNVEALDSVDAWLHKLRAFWGSSLDALEELLSKRRASERPKKENR